VDDPVAVNDLSGAILAEPEVVEDPLPETTWLTTEVNTPEVELVPDAENGRFVTKVAMPTAVDDPLTVAG